MKISSILGLNARAQLSYEYNTARGRSIANSKLKTKKTLARRDIPIPKIYKRFTKHTSIFSFDWQSLPPAFALKPSRGLGGDGIVVVKRRTKDGSAWLTTSRKRVTEEDLKLHTLDILEGAYSMNNGPDTAFVEEYVGRHKAFRKYAYRGTPDIRVIVFNSVPIMAMLRLPTKDSGGRANLHQGAIGVGIDIATGITTHAIWYGDTIKYKPGSKRKLHGIKIPNWTRALEIAVRCQEASKLGYLGVDIVLHPEKGPMVLEINAQPGFQIQLANMGGLRKRIEMVDELKIRDAAHGVNVAKALFVSGFAHKVRSEGDRKTISALEDVVIYGSRNGYRKHITAKVDTGAWRTSLEYSIAKEMGLLNDENVFLTRRIKSSLGTEDRPIIGCKFRLGGRKIKTYASVAKRERLKYSIIIGRRDLAGFLVDPNIESRIKENEDRAIKRGDRKLEKHYGHKL